MKKILFIIIPFVIVINVFSRDYDLVVTKKGDSIAYIIDSNTDTDIYIETKSNNYWIHTQIPTNDILEFKYNAIDKKEIIFKPGTSYIERDLSDATVRDIQKNSASLGYNIILLNFSYERSIPISNKAGLIVGAGIIQEIGFESSTNPVAKFGIILGGYKHFFETGAFLIVPTGNGLDNMFLPLVGYRYQHPKGFFMRVDILYYKAFAPLPGLSLGYSF